ncbi:MAG: hypothetical protein EP330_30875 [Deltaproteobacteria bacterium]|nr:MAG: hypothetical protein EP330_30875 [Deltaproteobacteria bacterium]
MRFARPSTLGLIPSLALFACNGDISVTEADNEPPVLSAVAVGAPYYPNDTVIIEATADDPDPDQDWDVVTLTTNIPEATQDGDPVEVPGGGLWTFSFPASVGAESISITATDPLGATTTTPVAITYVDNTPPAITIDAPTAEQRFASGSNVVIEVTVTDPDQPNQDLQLAWSGLADLSAAPATPDSTGFATFTASGLADGAYTVSLTVTDDAGDSATRTRTFHLVNPDGDADGDRAIEFGGTDCNDGDDTIYGGADEICDDKDNDCNGTPDDNATDATVWYADLDVDGYGDPATAEAACDRPAGKIDRGGDCDDDEGAAYPGNTEICDGIDNDCLNGVDDGLSTQLFYLDADGDDWGAGTAVNACVAPPQHVATPGDCDDGNSAVNPDASEVCNGINDDCNNGVDEGLPTTVWYYDGDTDTYGDPSNSQTTCDTTLANHVDRAGDCNDNDNTIYPNQTDDCNGVNNDCDGQVDEDDPPATWYADSDRDNYGDPNTSQQACTQPNRYVADNRDCNDGDDTVHPFAVDDCNGVNNDCDASVDEDDPPATWFYDGDTDTYGTANQTLVQCTQPADYVDRAGDCDDGAANINPGVTEVCNGINDDCNNGVDEGFALTDYFYDNDEDGYGVTPATAACTEPNPPAKWATEAGDCNDSDASIHPNQVDDCDTINNDCDAQTDEDDPPLTWYRDADTDSFGDLGNSREACTQPSGYVDDSTDCDDTVGTGATVYPGAPETCNQINDDCDAATDEGLATSDYYEDVDGDGYGGAGPVQQCGPIGDWDATVGGDCDDNESQESPGGTEVCGDGFDNDCVGGDDSCGPDYSGYWQVRDASDGTTVDFTCADGGVTWDFGRMLIDHADPLISLWALDQNNSDVMNINGCEPGNCGGGAPGLQGAFASSSTVDFSANSSIAPQLGVGFFEYYNLVETSGTASTYVTFTSADHFEGAVRITFARGTGIYCGVLGSCAIPPDCVTTVIPIYGDRE